MIEIHTYTFSVVRTCNGVKSNIPDDSIKMKGLKLVNPIYIKSVWRMENESLFAIEIDSSDRIIYTDYSGYSKIRDQNKEATK